MPIPETQLETWSHQGSIIQSSNTYNAIKGVLEASSTPWADKSFKVFLQGSYGNDTNIYAESDVDIVIQLNDSFQSDVAQLTEDQKSAYETAFPSASYTHQDFKRDVLSVLTKNYGTAVKSGDKALSIDANSSRRKADVIVAIQYRRYQKFLSFVNSKFEEGICFWNSSGERVVNYPMQHSANLTAKHQTSSFWLKPTIRVFKNMRSQMVEAGMIKAGTAPSYFIEGLLYNVPSAYLMSNYQTCVVNALNWYYKEAIKADLVCANREYYLLRNGHHTCWNQSDCDLFVEAAIRFWNDWR